MNSAMICMRAGSPPIGRSIRIAPILTMLRSRFVFVAVLSPRCIPSATAAAPWAKKSDVSEEAVHALALVPRGRVAQDAGCDGGDSEPGGAEEAEDKSR